MEIRVTDDRELVKLILKHPANWPFLANDDVPDEFDLPEEWLYLLVLDPEPVGVYLLHAIDDETVSGHLAMLPEGRGAGVIEATAKVVDFVWSATPAKRILVNVDEDNERAIKAAQKCGFRLCGREKEAVRKGGVLLDFIQLEMRRE